MKSRIIHSAEKLKKGTLLSPTNALIGGSLGALAHFTFYFVFKYGFHLPYENFWLRMIATLMCISVMFMFRLPASFRPYIPFYWHFFLIFVLPFIFTVNLLMNNFHELWLYWEIFMVFILMMFVPNWLIFSLDLIIGIVGAIFFYLLSSPHVPLHPDFNIPLYSIVMIFSIVAGYIFSFSNWKSIKDLERNKAEEKYTALEALAGSIAHEMRNPLSQIRHNLDEILLEVPQTGSESDCPSFSSQFETINKRATQAQMAVNRGLHVITMTLCNLSENHVSKEELTCLSAVTTTRKALEEYGYASDQEKQMLHLWSGEDFIFLGDENNYMLVLYNLLVNAFHALRSTPGGRIDIEILRGEATNRIIVRDNGPGIPAAILPDIFTPFFTSGKKGGTGLGLAFCQRMMHSFKGDITCNSEEGGYTEFSLEFPVLEQSFIDKFESRLYEEFAPFFSGKKLLLIAISEKYCPILRSQLAPLNIEVDEAADLNEALNLIEANRYDLILTNAQLAKPAIETLAQSIMNKGREIPLVACNASSSSLAAPVDGFDALISMPPALAELLGTLKSSLEMVRETLKESLSGKNVLVADDLDFNRRVIKLMLGKLGVTVFEASNGLEALELLKSQHFDLLVMDMKMPVLDGFDTARRIRASSSAWRGIPILGMSGNLDNSMTGLAKECGINDSLIKPLKLKPFLQKVSAMLRISQPVGK